MKKLSGSPIDQAESKVAIQYIKISGQSGPWGQFFGVSFEPTVYY